MYRSEFAFGFIAHSPPPPTNCINHHREDCSASVFSTNCSTYQYTMYAAQTRSQSIRGGAQKQAKNNAAFVEICANIAADIAQFSIPLPDAHNTTQHTSYLHYTRAVAARVNVRTFCPSAAVLRSLAVIYEARAVVTACAEFRTNGDTPRTIRAGSPFVSSRLLRGGHRYDFKHNYNLNLQNCR